MSLNPLVSVVVLNWNGINDTKKCIKSIKNQSYSNYEIIIVDNGSKDDSVLQLEGIDGIKLIKLARNIGFAGGHVEGYKHCSGDYIALINNDMVLAVDWLEQMMKCAKENKAGVVGGRSYMWDNDHKPYNENSPFSSYQTVSPITGHTVMLHKGERVVEANNLSGSNLLVSRKTVERVGYLDPDFFCYYEETDFIARAKRAGIKCLYCPAAKTWHKSGESSKNQPYFYLYHMHRNRFWFAYKNYDYPQLRKFLSYYRKEYLRALKNNRKQKNLHDSAMIAAYHKNLTMRPILSRKRLATKKLGSSYVQKIIRLEEGFDDITVLIPCYNYGDYIIDALESLEAQALRPIEVFILNDGSTDDSAKVAKSFIDSHKTSSIKYTLIDKPNEGVITTKNLALELVTTSWMMFLDADDKLHPDYIYECVKKARLNNSDVVYTDMQMFGSNDALQTVIVYNKMLIRSVNFVHNSALMKTDIFKRSGGYKQKMSIGFEDWELYLSISELSAQFSYVNKPLFYYRRHEGASRDILAQNKLPIVMKYLEELHPKLYRLNYYWWFEAYRSKEHVKELLKLPLYLGRHTKSHIVKHSLKNPDRLASKVVANVRKKRRGRS